MGESPRCVVDASHSHLQPLKQGFACVYFSKALTLIFPFNFSFCKLEVNFFLIHKIIQKKNIVVEGIVSKNFIKI